MTTTRYQAAAWRAVGIGSLEVVVLHTTTPATLRALPTAAGLAAGLGARIRWLVSQIVSFALPLDSPPIGRDSLDRRFQTAASDVEVETHVEIRLCRDQCTVLQSALRSLPGGAGRKGFLVALCRATLGSATSPRRAPGGLLWSRVRVDMPDLFYIAVACLFFVACWFSTRACEKL